MDARKVREKDEGNRRLDRKCHLVMGKVIECEELGMVSEWF